MSDSSSSPAISRDEINKALKTLRDLNTSIKDVAAFVGKDQKSVFLNWANSVEDVFDLISGRIE